MEKFKSSFYFDNDVKLIIHHQEKRFTIKHYPFKNRYIVDMALEDINIIKQAIEFAKQVLEEDETEQQEMPETETLPIDNTTKTNLYTYTGTEMEQTFDKQPKNSIPEIEVGDIKHNSSRDIRKNR